MTDPRLVMLHSYVAHLTSHPPTPIFTRHSFNVSLTCGRDSDKEQPLYDVALKLTARFSDRQFLRCARLAGKWVGEEASTAYFPFIPDQPFRVNTFFHVHLDSTVALLSDIFFCCFCGSKSRTFAPQRESQGTP